MEAAYARRRQGTCLLHDKGGPKAALVLPLLSFRDEDV